MTTDPCRVMVVDDNHDVADSAVMLLHGWGHEAIAVYSGEECIAKARDFDPDVILMDIGLPGLDGFEAKDQLEQVCPGVRVVALTGYTQADIRRRARDKGFAGHLLKPVEGPSQERRERAMLDRKGALVLDRFWTQEAYDGGRMGTPSLLGLSYAAAATQVTT